MNQPFSCCDLASNSFYFYVSNCVFGAKTTLVCACVCVLALPLQSETELACAGLDLVLGLQVVHALRGDAVNGQNDVADAHLGSGRLPTVRQLQERPEKTRWPKAVNMFA